MRALVALAGGLLALVPAAFAEPTSVPLEFDRQTSGASGGLRGEAFVERGAFAVNLTWDAPAAAVRQWNVVRNSVQVAQTGPTTYRWQDLDVRAGETYDYEVQRVDHGATSLPTLGPLRIAIPVPAKWTTVTLASTAYEPDTPLDVEASVRYAIGDRPVVGAVLELSVPRTGEKLGTATTDATGTATFRGVLLSEAEPKLAMQVVADRRAEDHELEVRVARTVSAATGPRGFFDPWIEHPVVTGLAVVVLLSPVAVRRATSRAVRARLADARRAEERLRVPVEDTTATGTHPSRERIFAAWRERVSGLPGEPLSVDPALLASATLASGAQGYALVVEASELLEREGTDSLTQRLAVPVALVSDPKPTRPTAFRSEVQAFPVATREIPCAPCGAIGKRTCHSCRGATKVGCGRCGGAGRSTCGGCGGSGQRRARSDSPEGKQYVGGGVYRVSSHVRCDSCSGLGWKTCGRCHGSGKVPCDTCGATGSVVCETCGGDTRLREVSRRVWTYEHRTLRSRDGPKWPLRDESLLGNVDGQFLLSGAAVDAQDASALPPPPERIAGPTPRDLLATAKRMHDDWKGKGVGLVLLREHRARIGPVSAIKIEWKDAETGGAFDVLAYGSARKFTVEPFGMPTSTREQNARAARTGRIAEWALLAAGVVGLATVWFFG